VMALPTTRIEMPLQPSEVADSLVTVRGSGAAGLSGVEPGLGRFLGHPGFSGALRVMAQPTRIEMRRPRPYEAAHGRVAERIPRRGRPRGLGRRQVFCPFGVLAVLKSRDDAFPFDRILDRPPAWPAAPTRAWVRGQRGAGQVLAIGGRRLAGFPAIAPRSGA
jgi:hypothetical protein